MLEHTFQLDVLKLLTGFILTLLTGFILTLLTGFINYTLTFSLCIYTYLKGEYLTDVEVI